MTLRQLQAFILIEQYRSFVQAAEQMHLTQAALSHLLRELETQLGIKLFHRTTRSVQLSTEGEIFLPYAQRVLANVQGAQSCAESLRQGTSGLIRLSTTAVLASTHIMSLVAGFQKRTPDIEIQIQEALPSDIVNDVHAERVDIGIGPARRMPESLQSELVFTSKLCVLCASNHPFAKKSFLTWQDLQAQPLLLAKGGGNEEIAQNIGNIISLAHAMEVAHFTTLLATIAIGNHVAVTTSYISPFLPVYQLCAIPLKQPVVERQILLYRRQDWIANPAALTFIDYLKNELAN